MFRDGDAVCCENAIWSAGHEVHFVENIMSSLDLSVTKEQNRSVKLYCKLSMILYRRLSSTGIRCGDAGVNAKELGVKGTQLLVKQIGVHHVGVAVMSALK